MKRFTAFFAPIFKNLWQTTPPDCCREQTGKIKKFSLRLPKRPLFTVVVVNSGQNTPPQSLYWWSKPVYPQTRAAEESGSFLEQDSTTVPKSANATHEQKAAVGMELFPQPPKPYYLQ
ncbi:hypothetical protein [Gemmiger formicilis]|uniref:hypothetical protein n=1 Tax=Gemmiger formicilis TaxID=745368 RepID=UPI003CCA8BE8